MGAFWRAAAAVLWCVAGTAGVQLSQQRLRCITSGPSSPRGARSGEQHGQLLDISDSSSSSSLAGWLVRGCSAYRHCCAAATAASKDNSAVLAVVAVLLLWAV